MPFTTIIRSGHVSFPGEEISKVPRCTYTLLPPLSFVCLASFVSSTTSTTTPSLVRDSTTRFFFCKKLQQQPLPFFEYYPTMFFSRASLVTLALSAIGAKAVYFVPVNTTVTQVSSSFSSLRSFHRGGREIGRLTCIIYYPVFFLYVLLRILATRTLGGDRVVRYYFADRQGPCSLHRFRLARLRR